MPSDINLQIIDILCKDSSMPFVEIAKQVGYLMLQFISELED
jgi:DNA-binding Lrp family transcriptional regulator